MASYPMPLEVEEQILENAISSPAIAMMRLSLEIDRQFRLILADVGLLKDYSGQSPIEALDVMARSVDGSTIPTELRDIIVSFWDLRNRVVHSSVPQQGYAMRAVDYGLRILRILRAIPRPSRIVRHAGVPLCSDRLCNNLRPDVRGVILESFGPRGENHGSKIHPSHRDYQEGQSVSWEWNINGESWDDTWYRDPATNEIKYAWTRSLEFVGRPLDLI
jgi:hypothetical protein